MKRLLLTLALTGVFCATEATVYYSQGSLAPNNLSSWNSNRNGTGAAPSVFINANDEFVVQAGHSMLTTSVWTVGSPTSKLTIENAGSLYGAHAILFNGLFQILSGGVYYHDNTGAVTNTAGSSIFGGNESFALNATVEIRNWISNTIPLPAGISWGNLVINYDESIGGNWNQQGTLTNIQGNLLIKYTGALGQDFRLSSNSSFTLNIGGNVEIDRGILFVKDGNAAGTSAIVQVNGGLTISAGAFLNLGTVDFKPNNEFRVKGNMLIFETGAITALSEEPMLVANGTTVQSLYAPELLNASFKIAKGSNIKLSSSLTMGSLRALIVAGTLAQGPNTISMNSGTLTVSGGLLNSRGRINMKDGVCQVCQGSGNFSFSTQWCATTGDTGVINLTNNTMQFNRSLASALRIGAMNSKGKLFLTTEATISFDGALSGPGPNRGIVELTGNGTLSFDEYSRITGEAFYNGSGGLLVIGAGAGITSVGDVGNIQVKGTRNYNFTGVNSYEYKSSLPQFTGNGFPSIITGALRINNSSPLGVTLNSATTIVSGATLQLAKGILVSTGSASLTMQRNSIFQGGSVNSYVNGPLKKIGETDFVYHVGKSGRYSPVSVKANGGGNPTDEYAVEYFPGDPASVHSNTLSQLIDHISTVEYWEVKGTPNRQRFLKFPITPFSGVNHFPSLVVAYYEGIGWINLGNGTTTGVPSNGSIEVSAVNYGSFTFGSTNIATNAMRVSLPIHINSFTARRDGDKALLNWEISADTDAEYFEVYSSNNNRDFTPVGRITADDLKRNYQYTDNNLHPGTTYYRIKVVEKNGNTKLSRIAAVIYQKSGIELITVIPSIAQQQTSLTIAASDRSSLQLFITDAQGRVVQTRMINLSQGTTSVQIDLSSFGAGLYYLHGVSKEGKSNVLRLLKQ